MPRSPLDPCSTALQYEEGSSYGILIKLNFCKIHFGCPLTWMPWAVAPLPTLCTATVNSDLVVHSLWNSVFYYKHNQYGNAIDEIEVSPWITLAPPIYWPFATRLWVATHTLETLPLRPWTDNLTWLAKCATDNDMRRLLVSSYRLNHIN